MRRRRNQRGVQVIEFAVCSMFLAVIFMGTMVVGMRLGRSIQVTQVARDTAHMYARFVDFSKPGNQDLVVRIASGLNLTRTGGDGVVILTTMLKVEDQQCLDGGVAIAECANRNKTVAIHRVVIGNAALRPSAFVTPSPSIIGSDGKIAPADYLRNSSAVSTTFPNVLALNAGEFAYVVEAFFQSPGLDNLGYYGENGVYARSIF